MSFTQFYEVWSGLRAIGGDNGVPLLKGIACEKGSDIRVAFRSNSSDDYWSRFWIRCFLLVYSLILQSLFCCWSTHWCSKKKLSLKVSSIRTSIWSYNCSEFWLNSSFRLSFSKTYVSNENCSSLVVIVGRFKAVEIVNVVKITKIEFDVVFVERDGRVVVWLSRSLKGKWSSSSVWWNRSEVSRWTGVSSSLG